MRFGERFRRIVGFIASDSGVDEHGEATYSPIATFFALQEKVQDWWGSPYAAIGWIVTAKHAVAASLNSGRTLHAIMRDHHGLVKTWPLPTPDWRFPSDESPLDLAVCPFKPPSELQPLMLPSVLNVERWVTPKVDFQEWDDPDAVRIELGQQVFFTGLFRWSRPMQDGAIPVVRSATVAALNQPGVWWEADEVTYTAPKVHLIDTRSKEGFSGSPVFVQWTLPVGAESDKHVWPGFWNWLVQNTHEERESFGWNHTITMWLGMFVAHEPDSGIGMVLPAQAILDFLGGPEVIEMKMNREKKLKERVKAAAGKGPVGQSIPELSGVDKTADTLGKLLRVPKEEADEVHRGHDQA